MSVEALVTIAKSNWLLWKCLERLPALALPDWYLGAGCIAQTVWNARHGYQPDFGIVDYDVIYFDRDLSEDKEASIAARIGDLTRDLAIRVDVKNQARVHCGTRVSLATGFGRILRAKMRSRPGQQLRPQWG